MARRTHFAAPLLLAVFLALILYVSLYPFRFAAGAPPVLETLRQLDWARASRGDMLNNFLLYLPLGFCLVLVLEPRTGRAAAVAAALVAGGLLSLALEITQASIPIRVPSLTDLSLNAAGALAGALGGTAWHALGSRMTSRANPRGHSAALALAVVVLWLLARLWPLAPDASLRQLKRAVRPLLDPQLAWGEVAAFFVGWLVVAQAVLHLARRDRSADGLLVVVALVLVGRAFTAGATLEVAELAALLLLLPALMLLSRLEDRTRSAVVAVVLAGWLVATALAPVLEGAARATLELPSLRELLAREAPAPQQLAGKTFNYVALGWLLAVAGLYPHVAAGGTLLLALALAMLHAGAAAPAYGWADLLIATVAAVAVLRWMPRR